MSKKTAKSGIAHQVAMDYINRCGVFFLILVVAVLFFCKNSYASEKVNQYDSKLEYQNRIKDVWNKRKPLYYEWLKGNGYVSDGFQRSHPYELYDVQLETNNLLKYSEYSHDLYMLEELVSLYVRALETLDETDQYVFYYYPRSPRRTVHTLGTKHKMWLNQNGEESIQASSQFLYIVSEAIVIIANLEQKEQTPLMQDFVRKFTPILLDHYNRWIFNSSGIFQVRGWGCKLNGKYVESGLNHFDFIKSKLERKLGDCASPSYCNAVTDTDMWIITGVSNILAASRKDDQLMPLSLKEFGRLLTYVKLGMELIKSRITYKKLKNFDRKIVEGVNFDLGVWNDHPGRALAWYCDKKYPDSSLIRNSKKQHQPDSGWDLSHARRFVNVFGSLCRNQELLHFDFPTPPLLEKLANQFIYGTFNRNFAFPLFTNFMDGTNGWYRVDYSRRKGFGYGPWDMSIAALTGGYGFWVKYNKDIRKLYCSLYQMVDSSKPEIRKHVIEHYEKNSWRDYKRFRLFNFQDLDNLETQSILIQFLPSMCIARQLNTTTIH